MKFKIFSHLNKAQAQNSPDQKALKQGPRNLIGPPPVSPRPLPTAGHRPPPAPKPWSRRTETARRRQGSPLRFGDLELRLCIPGARAERGGSRYSSRERRAGMSRPRWSAASAPDNHIEKAYAGLVPWVSSLARRTCSDYFIFWVLKCLSLTPVADPEFIGWAFEHWGSTKV